MRSFSKLLLLSWVLNLNLKKSQNLFSEFKARVWNMLQLQNFTSDISIFSGNGNSKILLWCRTAPSETLCRKTSLKDSSYKKMWRVFCFQCIPEALCLCPFKEHTEQCTVKIKCQSWSDSQNSKQNWNFRAKMGMWKSNAIPYLCSLSCSYLFSNNKKWSCNINTHVKILLLIQQY